MKPKLNSAIVIGYGSVGRRHAALLNNRYNALSVVDSNPIARQQASVDCDNATVASSLADLDRSNWDWTGTIAVIATWGPSHADIFHELAGLGVRHILCEKPIAHSVKIGVTMVKTAEELGISMGVNHHMRYSSFSTGLTALAEEFGLGEPCSMFVHGGANGLITRGIHQIDLASQIFGQGPESVVSTAVGAPINPRSPNLMFYGGTAAWDFGNGREVTFSFSNSSSISRSLNIYYRDAVVVVSMGMEVEVRRRVRDEVERFPAVTRTGDPTDIAYTGPVPGILTATERSTKLLDEIESGTVRIFPPALAIQAMGACIGALAAGTSGRAVGLPIDPESSLGREEWPIS